jgi:virginiamycin B lyase
MTPKKVALLFTGGIAACSRFSPPQHPDPLELRGAPITRPTLHVDIREFPVPTEDALPHDPAVGPDGALWVTEQKANAIGRLDPVSGYFREYPLPIPGSGPHGLAVDAAGDVWFTANNKGYIGKLTPESGEVVEYRMPDPHANDPHSPILAPDGTLWFTVLQANMVGALDTKLGVIRLGELPTPRALPYGLALGADGAPYVCEFGANKIARVEPRSMTVREYFLPEGARPRRIASAPDGALYYTDFARSKLGRLEPKSGRVAEWASPGGPSARPYGVTVTRDGHVWYSESGVEPNTLVRFDPKTERFLVAPIPSGGGVVRNMVATSDGQIVMACSGKNRVAVASLVTPDGE